MTLQDLLLVLVLPGLVGALLSALLTHRLRKRVRLWRAVAAELGLQEVQGEGAFTTFSLTGRLGTRGLRFQHHEEKYEPAGTLLAVGGDSGVSLRREDMAALFHKGFVERELQVGDAEFDHRVYLRGDPAVLRAVLDAETRGLVLRLLGGHTLSGQLAGEVVSGDVRAWVSDRDFGSVEKLTQVVREVLALARRLDRPADVLGRLAENLKTEPEWRVRLQDVLLLAEASVSHPAAREALKRACGGEQGEVRLQAALGLREEGRETLLEIAGAESEDDSRRAKAVAGLGDLLTVERGLELLASSLRRRHVQAARACLESLGRSRDLAVVEPLARVLAVEKGELAVVAAQALGATRRAGAESPLLQALRGVSSAVRVAAAEALGRVGSVAAVLPLKKVAETQPGELGRAARQAFAAIQSRLPGATPGQLSLAEGEAGRLSLAGEDPAGRVSLAGQD